MREATDFESARQAADVLGIDYNAFSAGYDFELRGAETAKVEPMSGSFGMSIHLSLPFCCIESL